MWFLGNKRNLGNTGDIRMRKIITFSFLFGLIFLSFSTLACGISWFEKEKEVKDEYLKKLFTPNIPYESVKVMEDNIGRKFIVIKTKEKISNKMLNEYNDILLSRGVNIYGTFHYGVFSWQKTVTDFAITITRKIEGEPDTIEASVSVVKDPIKKEPVVAASAKGKEIRIAVEKDFGKKWKRIKIIPDKEPDVPEPKIGRYPGSKLRYTHKWPASKGRRTMWIYVSKDSFKEITYYYERQVIQAYQKVTTPLALRRTTEKFENPNAYAHPLEIFEIKTVGQKIDFFGHMPFRGEGTVDITLRRSIDPNLRGYIEIEIWEK